MSQTHIHQTVDERELLFLGMNQVAYLRAAEVDGMHGYAICAADGSVIGFAPSRTQAIAAIMQHDMELARVH